MKLAVLNCDEIKPSFSEKFGQYPAMFETALNNLDIRYNIVSYDIQKGIYPKNIAENDVYIITGSQSAVYEKHDWLENLFEFIKEINKKEIGLIGICFGHQVIAHALGGNVEKAKSGWHIGLKPLEVQDNELFMKRSYQLIFNHQDQVINPPSNAVCIGATEHCKYALMIIGKHIISCQGHVEFSKEYARELLDMRRKIFGENEYQKAVDSLKNRDDSVEFFKEMISFFMN